MKTLSLTIPNWSRFESELGIATPFWRWTVVDQPLIDHWLDHARDRGYGRIKIFLSNNNDNQPLANYLREAPLLDCECEILPASIGGLKTGDTATLSNLPGFTPLTGAPASAWDLVDHHHQLEQQRLTHLWTPSRLAPPSMCLGRFARVHSSARIEGPVWIGDHSYIGPNSQVGPFTVVARNCVVSQGVSIRATSLTEETVIGAFTQFNGHLVSGSNILNRSGRFRLEDVDPSIARSAKTPGFGARFLSAVR